MELVRGEKPYLRNVHRTFTATISLCGTILVSWGLRINRCHPRFHTIKRSSPGLIVQRSRVFVPIFWDSVSYCTKLLRTRLGVQAYAPWSCHSRCTKLPWGSRPKSFSASASSAATARRWLSYVHGHRVPAVPWILHALMVVGTVRSTRFRS